MKKIIFFLSILITLSFSVVDNWINIKIDKKVSLNLPRKPDREKTGPSVVYSADSEGCIFLITVSPVPDKVNVPTEKEALGKFLQGVVDGNLKSTNPENVEIKDVVNAGFSGKQVSYKGTFPGTDARLNAMKQIFLIDKTFYVFDFWTLDEEYA